MSTDAASLTALLPPALSSSTSSFASKKMSALLEITRLFARLASDLRRPNAAAGDEITGSISSLVHSLNPDDDGAPRVRVLDAALSLMCFTSTEVLDAQIEFTVDTIVAVLSSLSSCKVSHFPGGSGELLQVGSSISYGELNGLIRACGYGIESLKGHQRLSRRLLYAVMKAALTSPCFPSSLSLSSTFSNENGKASAQSADRRTAISELRRLLPEEESASCNDVIPMRLIMWYLDPLILKHDISEILKETIQRPFCCLRKELYDRLAWRSIILCLVTSPTVFIETRGLLHDWFLATGWASILEVKIAVITAVLDVLSMPMQWGVPMELGLKYPFSHAYFPNTDPEFLAILTGPISSTRFLHLVHHIKMAATPIQEYSPITTPSDAISKRGANHNGMVDSNSTWAMLMDFPAWFYYSTALLFHRRNPPDSSLSRGLRSAVGAEVVDCVELFDAAVAYIAYIICPINQTHSSILIDLLNEISRSWTTGYLVDSGHGQQTCSNIHDKRSSTHSKTLRIHKVNDYKKPQKNAPNRNGSEARLWLSVFHHHCTKFYNKLAEENSMEPATEQSNFLLLKIPLGILISCPSNLDEEGSGVLFHYAATGKIQILEELKEERRGYSSHDECTSQPRKNCSKWALDGARLVLNLIDILEDISSSVFDCENARVDFVRHVKSKASSYLPLCVEAIFDIQFQQVQADEVGIRDMLLDLYVRLMRWKEQGHKLFKGCKELDDVLDNFERRFSLSGEKD